MKLSALIVNALVLILIVFGTAVYVPAMKRPIASQTETALVVVQPVILPITWDNTGMEMQRLGVIDRQKLEAVYEGRGGISANTKKLLDVKTDSPIVIGKDNANELLNVLWAFGLANDNEILRKGPMTDTRYSGVQNFASTGGWTLASGDPMSHYSAHQLVTLTPGQQELVERVSKNIYRPCCNNSTYFPDCNHGMAMLGLLELMAAQNVSEQEMYKVALDVNRLWFPNQYAVIDQYLAEQKITSDPKTILSAQYSSGSGYARVAAALKPRNQGGSGGSCGV